MGRVKDDNILMTLGIDGNLCEILYIFSQRCYDKKVHEGDGFWEIIDLLDACPLCF